MNNQRNMERRQGQRRQVETMSETEARIANVIRELNRSCDDRRQGERRAQREGLLTRLGFHLAVIGSVCCYILLMVYVFGK